MISPRSHRRSCSEAMETGCCGRLMLCRDFVSLQWQRHRTCSPRQLRIRHAKWQFLAHVIGSAETWFPGGILRSAFKLISTNFYEPCQAGVFFLYWISVIWLVLVVLGVFLPWPGISALVSPTLCALDKKLENVVRTTPATNSQGQICHPQVVGLRKKSWWMGRATYYWSEMKEDLRSSRWVNDSDIKKKNKKKTGNATESVVKPRDASRRKLPANSCADGSETEHYVSAGLFGAVWQHSAVVLPKALKGRPQINELAQPESFLVVKGTARPLIALLICEIRRLMELLFQPEKKNPGIKTLRHWYSPFLALAKEVNC